MIRRVLVAVLLFAVVIGASLGPLSAALSGQAPAQARQLLRSTADLHDKRIGVQLGTVYDLYAAKTFPKATVVQFSTYQEVTLAVSAGKVDAGLSDIDTLNEVRRANADLVPFGDPIFSSDVAAGFRKADGPLRASFNAFLAQIRSDGTYAGMVDRWMTTRQTAMPQLPSRNTTGTLTIGVSSGGFPFAAVQDGALAGFDIELAQRFGRAIGKDVRLVDQEFGGLIAALSSGKIDVIVADMFVTPERQQQIDFSESYFAQDSVAFTTRANLQPSTPTGQPPRRRHPRSRASWRASRPASGAISSSSSAICSSGRACRPPSSSRCSRRCSARPSAPSSVSCACPGERCSNGRRGPTSPS